ncbi:DNA-binding response regulator, NarL/FixJ family, contains REC and HTH domains [Actinokineospora alba]|uniref:DNA-binding response regulator, NarL/FixJ family, contains REC and HTH domains n=1 Tax=Actinokineospora alba TaxID=504798 RepID=A0A1H0R3Z2_9PSEU|nr:response regulator transcription factor [Actinokineospora alba]TDP70263.1 LuxR family two component transcriptional regulator [Actinokineospora alba]SDI35474.1 DNA-binding response regulator, NarL/FixJ family, contains REC and HTH domains [Actinokineospora alba]SDP24140.1 DNA-binding response regulator, NarL/FixJ family, contains REC and HTH domains [Actinokineospora alba]
MIRVLLVDDHPIVRTGLRTALAGVDGVELVAEVATGEEAVAVTERLRPDVVLMDLQLGPGINGAEATRRIRALPDPARVLVLTTYDSEADILAAIEAGATGYLLKDTDPAALVPAIRTAARGETVLAPNVASRLVARFQAPAQSLTPREIAVLQLVADGHSNKAAARALFVTEATVKSHLVQVFMKLGVDSRTAAVSAARLRGLVR